MTQIPSRGAAARGTDLLRMDFAVGHKNMQQLIGLRWIAIVGQIVTIAVVTLGFGVALPLAAMAQVLALLIAFNVASQMRSQGRTRVPDHELFIALLVDVAVLTTQLHLSGGTTNPFIFLYLLQISLGAMLLKTRWAWMLVAITASCFMGLAFFSAPLQLPLDHDQGLGSLYIQGMMICFALNAVLLVASITQINHNIRERDARLADLRQRAIEHEHIVRMGLLASGAAHELGTPLATIDVILGDWQHMAVFSGNPETQQELQEMQAQLERCKRILSGILLSAGETRGESASKTTVRTFLDQLAAQWHTTKPTVSLQYTQEFAPDQSIVGDSTLQQMLCNVLDNAAEASPQWVGLHVSREGSLLVITVSDRGPGFPPFMLERLGTPYQSSKGRAGSGLGLFLSMHVAATLGGTLNAHNAIGGGAVVRLALPLSALTIGPHASTRP